MDMENFVVVFFIFFHLISIFYLDSPPLRSLLSHQNFKILKVIHYFEHIMYMLLA